MAARVQALPDDLRRRLHAAQLMPTLASCVIALVHNALDAQATSVTIDVEETSWAVRVSDNGAGMRRQLLETLGSWGATTLQQPTTEPRLGTRGMALAALAALAVVEVGSRDPTTGISWVRRLAAAPSDATVAPRSLPCGSWVTMSDIFQSLPVRRMATSPRQTEADLVDAIARLSVVFPQVALVLRASGRLVLQVPACATMGRACLRHWDERVAAHARYVRAESPCGTVRVHGLVAMGASTTTTQWLFVLRRPIPTARDLIHGLRSAANDFLGREAMEGVRPVLLRPHNGRMLSRGFMPKNAGRAAVPDAVERSARHLACALQILCKPSFMDVSIEPDGSAVEFADQAMVLDLLRACVDAYFVGDSESPDAATSEPCWSPPVGLSHESSDGLASHSPALSSSRPVKRPREEVLRVTPRASRPPRETPSPALSSERQERSAERTGLGRSLVPPSGALVERLLSSRASLCMSGSALSTRPNRSEASSARAGRFAWLPCPKDDQRDDTTRQLISAVLGASTDEHAADGVVQLGGSLGTANLDDVLQTGRVIRMANRRTVELAEGTSISRAMLCRARLVGQLDRKFLIAHDRDPATGRSVLMVVDQHAADERVRLEQLQARIPSAGIESQPCHVRLALTPMQRAIALQFPTDLATWGWRWTAASDPLLHSTPAVFGVPLAPHALVEHLQALADRGGLARRSVRDVVPAPVFRALCGRACRGAIMFGDALSPERCCELLALLNQCALPFQCAHGRPSMIPLALINP